MTPTPPPPASSSSRRPILLALAGCALLVLCVVVVGAAGGAAYFLNRPRASVSEPAVEYILDASPRMALEAEGDTGTRLSVAQGVLAEIVRPADPELTAGLRVFGGGSLPEACRDTNLVVPLAPASQGEISSRALEIQSGAAAEAAVAEAMIAAIADLSTTAGPHTLVVVTGGADTCNAEAGQLIAQEAERAGIRLQTFVVGYQVPDSESEAIRGMVDAAGDSTYLNAEDADELRAILDSIQKYVDDPTTTFPTVTLGTPAPVAVGTQATPVAGVTAEATTSGPGPDNTPAVGPGPTSQAGTDGYAAQTACDHPYLPLRQGATWTYATPEGNFTWSVTSASGDLENAEAILRLAMDEFTIDYHWNCTAEGIVSYDFGSSNIAGLGEGFAFEVSGADGYFLPAAERLVPGYSWHNNYTMNSSSSAGGESISVSSTVNQNFTAVALEANTTEAGTFDTLRVNGASSYNSSVAGAPSISFDTSQTIWFGYGVGMIRNESTASGSSSTTTLVSYNIPGNP